MANFLKNLFDKKPKVEKVDIARRFELLSRVGQGSMSKVWRARDAMTGHMLAVKVLDKVKTERFEARFVGLKKPGEGEISISLQHRNIVKTLEHGITTTDEPYLIMEFVEGVALSYLVDTQNDQMREHCLNYIIQMADGIDYLHRQNWIHRDICPRNVMVDQDNCVKLIDFGLVVPNTPDFQKPGNRTGTANYMAPELIKRQKTDQRIDIFSFSVTAYEMYTKRLPWDVPAQETLDTVLQHINKPPTPIAELAPHIDPRVAEVIMKGLSSNPDTRWQSMSELLIPLRKAHADIEAKKELERAKLAAKSKSKSSTKAKPDLKAQKKAEDDAFFEQLVHDETPSAKHSKPVSSSTKSAHPKTNPSRPSNEAGLSAKPSLKAAPPKVPVVANSDDELDEFDGIEVEEEGHKLDAAEADDFAGIEIEVEGSLDDGLPSLPVDTQAEVPALLMDNEVASRRPPATKPAPVDDDEPILRLPDDD